MNSIRFPQLRKTIGFKPGLKSIGLKTTFC